MIGDWTLELDLYILSSLLLTSNLCAKEAVREADSSIPTDTAVDVMKAAKTAAYLQAH